MILTMIMVQTTRDIMKKLTNKELVKSYYAELGNKQNKDYIEILFDDITFLDIWVLGDLTNLTKQLS
jgi:hypothetical protein